MKIIVRLAIVWFCSAALLCAGALSNQVVPGQRLGPIRMGMSWKDVQAMVGKPDRHNCANDICTSLYLKRRLNIVTANDMVTTISTVSKGYVTERGIKVGSPVASVLKAYGKGYLQAGCKPTCVLYYNGLGIAFAFPQGGPVQGITIYSPSR